MSRVETCRLRVLSWAGGWGQALRTAVSDPFARATGVQVEHVRHVGLRLPQALLSALERRESPPVDVVWCNSVPALHSQERGYCSVLDQASQVYGQLRARARPRHTPLCVVHPYVVYYVLAYHEAAVPEGPPTSWNALLDPRHHGRIALYPGGNGFYPIAQVMGGGKLADIPAAMQPCWSFIRTLRQHIGELDYSIGMEERLQARKLDLCFRALTNALAFRAAGLPVSWCLPKEGTTDTVDAFWIPRGLSAARQAVAQQYIAFALRADVQTHWCELLGAMPVHVDARVPQILQDRADLPEHADDCRGLLHIDEHLKVRHQRLWEDQFSAIFAEPVETRTNASAGMDQERSTACR